MANLLSQNIGTNYKSILNLDATTINTPLDATLRAVTDGMGTSSPLQLSTDQVGLSRTVNLSAGATNPRLFNEVYTINNSGAQTGTLTGIFLNATETALNGITHNLMDLQVGGVSRFSVSNNGNISGFAAIKAGGSSPFFWDLRSVMTSPSNGIILLQNYTGTDFSRLQLGGTTNLFPAIKRNGAAIDFRLADDSAYCNVNANAFFLGGLGILGASSDGVLRITNNANNDFNRLQLGGTTSSFPAIKRNGAGIDFVKADDSASCNIGALNISALAGISAYSTIEGYSSSQAGSFSGAVRVGSGGSNTATAILDVVSTTKGFLMPRQTTAQILLIATPAAGLQVYNTTLNQPCFFDGTIWNKVNHSPM